MSKIVVPPGTLAVHTDDEALKRRRQEIRERLLRNQEVVVDSGGQLQVPSSQNSGAIRVPEGKLALFYWYDSDRDLYNAEVEAMHRFFPGFSLQKEPDGRLSWIGTVKPGMLEGARRSYLLQVVYEHSHPNNDSYGGSIKVYSIDPDLADLAGGSFIPHTLVDGAGQIYICTARREDFKAGQIVTTAASSIAWAVKWIAVFEMWLDGVVTTQQFAGHEF